MSGAISPAKAFSFPAALTDDEAVKIGGDAGGNIPTEPAEIATPAFETAPTDFAPVDGVGS